MTTDPEWFARARCRGVDPETFFPFAGESTSAARALCDVCVVRQLCLDYAIDNHVKFGIWGGVGEKERRRIRRRRRLGLTA